MKGFALLGCFIQVDKVKVIVHVLKLLLGFVDEIRKQYKTKQCSYFAFINGKSESELACKAFVVLCQNGALFQSYS